MRRDVAQALSIDSTSSSRARTVDITTIGRRSGIPRRIEIWFYRAEGRLFLTGHVGRRDWYANVLEHPQFTLHLKNDVVADLPAVARPITDRAERARIFAEIAADLTRDTNPARLPPSAFDNWLDGSPLVEVTIPE